jgi:hypothetical protein
MTCSISPIDWPATRWIKRVSQNSGLRYANPPYGL